MRTTSKALTGKSSRARSVWGTYRAGRAAGRAAADRQLAQQRAEEGRLAAAVRAEHADNLARGRGEGDVAQRVGARHVAAAEPVDVRLAPAPPGAQRGRARATTANTPPPSTASAGPAPTLSASAR